MSLAQKHQRKHHRFLIAWLKSPLKMGAVVPSSRSLARAIAQQVDLSKPGVVIELGAGTGAVTHALLEAGVSPDRLVVVERDKGMHAILCSHFRELTILQADACELVSVLQQGGVTQVNAIVSSLPLLSMPAPLRLQIEEQMAHAIDEHGTIIQFTYGRRSPLGRSDARKLSLRGHKVRTVLANLPPAHIWVYQKAPF
ncbi:MAG: rRNA adenine N-6-methyltransferase family protein [Rickettsiales bacterium]|nr:rRNA adenine N-6-methyltransferase family protein [Rickettsiales bacterium]